jgi:intracellular septation protein
MKLLFDLLPLIFFFATLELAGDHPANSVVYATERLGSAVSGGSAGAREAPAILASAAGIAVALAQLAWLRLRRERAAPALWVSVLLVSAFGAAWVGLHNEAFVKWKPSILYWLLGLILWLSQVTMRRNLVRALIGRQVALSQTGWQRLNAAWVGFFGLMGLLNLWVVHNFPLDTWIEFKQVVGPALFALFVLVQALALQGAWRPAGVSDDEAPASR